MKYHKPVSELLEECAASLPVPFTAVQVVEWFRTHYPDVKASTVRTHIHGLTSVDGSTRGSHQFAARRVLLERVGRGLFRPVGSSTATTHTSPSPADAPSPQPGGAGVVLVGCVKSKRSEAAPARDLYTSALFSRRRRYAEKSRSPWFVASSRWGLLAPDDVAGPYDLYLGDTPASYRRAWGAWVTEQLAVVAPLQGLRVEIHAGDHYVSALRGPLEMRGAAVVDPVVAGSMGETLAWYDRHEPGEPVASDDVSSEGPDDEELVSALVDRLSDRSIAVPAAELAGVPREHLAGPGLYSWWVDDVGAADLSAGLGVAVHAGLIYAGQAGATRWPSGRPSANTLYDRLLGMHLGKRMEISTFRRTLGAALGIPADHDGEVGLTAWMHRHLSVVAVGNLPADTLGGVEEAVLRQLDPPLNLKGMPGSPARAALSARRRVVASEGEP